MKSDFKYLIDFKKIQIPTHTKYGWLFYLALIAISKIIINLNTHEKEPNGNILLELGNNLMPLVYVFYFGVWLGFIVEIVSTILKKNNIKSRIDPQKQ